MPVSPSRAFIASGVTSDNGPVCAWTEKTKGFICVVRHVFKALILSSDVIYLIFLNECFIETVMKIRV